MFIRANYSEFAKIDQTLGDPAAGGKVILLAESGSKEGGSLVGYGLARFLSNYAHEKTAFIDHTSTPFDDSSKYADRGGTQPTILNWDQVVSSENGLGAAVAISKLRQEFAYVVIAAGAVKDTTDLLRLSGIVSAALFIVEAAKTRRSAAR